MTGKALVSSEYLMQALAQIIEIPEGCVGLELALFLEDDSLPEIVFHCYPTQDQTKH